MTRKAPVVCERDCNPSSHSSRKSGLTLPTVASRGKEVADWCKAQGDWELEVAERPPGVRGFSVLPTRWIVERTFGWLARTRSMSKDYERQVQTSEPLIEGAMMRLLVARLGQRS
jgi:putative transposase